MTKLPTPAPKPVDKALEQKRARRRELLEEAKRALPDKEAVPDEELGDLLSNVRD